MRVVHIFRSPVGGLFRHVRDLVRGHGSQNIELGLICDGNTGGPTANAMLEKLKPQCSLGISRLPMARGPSPKDWNVCSTITEQLRTLKPDIIHTHGAKGGFYGRMAARRLGIPALYTPHGGSTHFNWNPSVGSLYLAAERLLRSRTAGFVFVCDYERRTFQSKVGIAEIPARVVYNGLWPEEMKDRQLVSDPSDILFIGELRRAKGVDVLLHALAALGPPGTATATIVGGGRSEAEFKSLAHKLGLQNHVRFVGPKPAAEAFRLGRLLVMPSRYEAFPYILLEAAGCATPFIATDVGGVAEAFPKGSLVMPGSVPVLTAALRERLHNREWQELDVATNRAIVANRFMAGGLCAEVLQFYQKILAAKRST